MGKAIICILIAVLACACPLLALLLLLALGLFNLLIRIVAGRNPRHFRPLIPQRENPLNLSVQFIERAALYTRLSHCFNGCNLPVSPSRYHSIPILGYLCAWSA